MAILKKSKANPVVKVNTDFDPLSAAMDESNAVHNFIVDLVAKLDSANSFAEEAKSDAEAKIEAAKRRKELAEQTIARNATLAESLRGLGATPA